MGGTRADVRRFPDRCPSAPRSDLRGLTYDLLSLVTRPDGGGGVALAGINRFLPGSIFIYLSLSEGCYRHRDPSDRAHARDVKPGQSIVSVYPKSGASFAARVKNDRVRSPKGFPGTSINCNCDPVVSLSLSSLGLLDSGKRKRGE